MKYTLLMMLYAVCTASTHASVVDVTAVPVPGNARVQIVSTDTIQNGLALSMATLESADTLEETAQFYRTLWHESGNHAIPGFVEAELNHWLLISRLENGVNTVVQLDTSESERTIGYLSQSLSGKAFNVPVDRYFPELQRVSTTQSKDGRVLSTMTVYASQASVNATAQRSANFLTQRGWSLVSKGVQRHSRYLVMARDSERLEIVITHSEDYPALVVVNRVIHQ